MRKEVVTFTVNGEPREVIVEAQMTLLEVLRDKLGLTGAKYGCGVAECGACTVLVDGKAVPSCLILAVTAKGKNIVTIEGLAEGNVLHPIQKAFLESGAIQCGYCTPGMIVITKALLEENPNPTREEVKAYLAGNLCRCTGYTKIVDAVLAAAEAIRKGGKQNDPGT